MLIALCLDISVLYITGCYAYWCSCCFMRGLGKDINEPSPCDCCIPSRVSVYRMKVRSILKIRVSFHSPKIVSLNLFVQGSALDDYCTSCCCGFCVAVQMKMELKSRGLA